MQVTGRVAKRSAAVALCAAIGLAALASALRQRSSQPEEPQRGWSAAFTPASRPFSGSQDAPGSAAGASVRAESELFPAPNSPLLSYEAERSAAELEAAQTPAPLDPVILLGPDAEGFARALAAYKAGDFDGGDAAAGALRAPFAAAAAQWVGLRLHPKGGGLARLSRFSAEHEDWPAQDWLRRRAEEALFAEGAGIDAVKAFFAQAKPLTALGKIALARALAREGDFEAAAPLAREVWRETELGQPLETALRKEFSDFLTPADHKYRADRLLYAEKNAAALRAAELAGKDVVLLAQARAAANEGSGGEKLFAAVPASLQKDPGLLFARLRLLRKQGKIAQAAELLLDAPRDPEQAVDGDAWWTERRLIARKLLDLGEARAAYAACAEHVAHSLGSRVDAEFHAGWIALRFLDDIPAAERHFARLEEIAETPAQKSRAAYWRARAAEARHSAGGDLVARDYYALAAIQSTTFYGQLALAKLTAANPADSSPLRAPLAPAEGDARDDSVRAVELLFAAGEREAAVALAAEGAKHLANEAQVAALAEAVARTRDARLSLTFGKLAAARGIALDDLAFPAYGVPVFAQLPGSAARSVIYAVARQESAFDPHVVSSAGAVGLMQMIDATARHTASAAGVSFDTHRLRTEPAFNAQLGAAHLGYLLQQNKGSYLLTFAAYNAGPRRVKEWIEAYGDPRSPDVDPIDWIERIPFSETRNYVQRVIENLVVYRAKFGESSTREPRMELAHAQ
jgi:soluble lytic murein transglycosylase